MHNFFMYYFEYREALKELEKFEASDAFLFMKGYLRRKKEKRKGEGRNYFYEYTYLVRVDYIDGKRHKKEKYVKKSDVAGLMEKLADKWKNRIKYKELKERVRTLLKKFSSIAGGEAAPWTEAAKPGEKNDEFLVSGKNVVSVLGEKLRSRAEGIISSLLLLFLIPYVYEPKLWIGRIVRPDFLFHINGKPILLEFLGMINNEEYLMDWERKQAVYYNNGYRMGDNLVCIAGKHRQDIDLYKIARVLIDVIKGKMPREIQYV